MEQHSLKWDSRHSAKIRQRLTKHVFPVFGSQPINEIKPLALHEFFKDLETRGKSGEIAHRVHNYCSRVFRYGLMTLRCNDNPCQPLKGTLKSYKVRHYPQIPVKELPEFLSKLENVKTSDQNKLAMKLLILTFVRQGELRLAKWVDIDWKAKQWRLPAVTTKMKEEHIVPLSPQALQVLEQLKTLTFNNPDGLILPSQNRQKNPGMSENTLNMIIEKMGYKGRQVPHGFRGLASTHLNESARFRYDAIERQLAHMPRDQIRSSYNHAEYLPERTQMMNYWGEFIELQSRSFNVINATFGMRA